MNTTTLRGVFPEPKPAYRRNFVRENIKHLKDLQGYTQNIKVASQSQELKPDRFKHVAPKVYSNMNTRTKLSKIPTVNRPVSYTLAKMPKSKYHTYGLEQKVIHRGVQTERSEEVQKDKFSVPTIALLNKNQDQGDVPQKHLTKNMQKLALDEKQNYIKQNIKNIKNNKVKHEDAPDPLLPPSNYQRGTVPKYIKEKKETNDEGVKAVEFEGENVSGLVLLPDEERKEYLRVARENYASLIKELNSMPMSNDTLKKRKRKMEIEDELKRLDEVIKIFQKPKVFVKADV